MLVSRDVCCGVVRCCGLWHVQHEMGIVLCVWIDDLIEGVESVQVWCFAEVCNMQIRVTVAVLQFGACVVSVVFWCRQAVCS